MKIAAVFPEKYRWEWWYKKHMQRQTRRKMIVTVDRGKCKEIAWRRFVNV